MLNILIQQKNVWNSILVQLNTSNSSTNYCLLDESYSFVCCCCYFRLPNNLVSQDESSASSSEQQQEQSKNLTSEEFLLAFKWPDLDHLFYFFNEELANLNRRLLVKPNQQQQQQQPADALATTNTNEQIDSSQLFGKFLNLLKCIFVLSK